MGDEGKDEMKEEKKDVDNKKKIEKKKKPLKYVSRSSKGSIAILAT